MSRQEEWLSITDARYAEEIFRPQQPRSITTHPWLDPKDSPHGMTTSSGCSVGKRAYRLFVWIVTKLKLNKKKNNVNAN